MAVRLAAGRVSRRRLDEEGFVRPESWSTSSNPPWRHSPHGCEPLDTRRLTSQRRLSARQPPDPWPIALHQLRNPGNGSNRIAPRCPRSTDINALSCLDDLYRPTCHSFASRGAGLADCDCPKPFASPPARGGGHYRLPKRCALTPGVLLALLPAVRLRVAPAVVRPGPQPGVVEPAPEQLAAIDDPADADQPRLHDQDGAQHAVADRVAGDKRLEEQA